MLKKLWVERGAKKKFGGKVFYRQITKLAQATCLISSGNQISRAKNHQLSYVTLLKEVKQHVATWIRAKCCDDNSIFM